MGHNLSGLRVGCPGGQPRFPDSEEAPVKPGGVPVWKDGETRRKDLEKAQTPGGHRPPGIEKTSGGWRPPEGIKALKARVTAVCTPRPNTMKACDGREAAAILGK